ncbi:hypothetical protein ACHAW6_013676 [Cyclotella cf. meneghiniana]
MHNGKAPPVSTNVVLATAASDEEDYVNIEESDVMLTNDDEHRVLVVSSFVAAWSRQLSHIEFSPSDPFFIRYVDSLSQAEQNSMAISSNTTLHESSGHDDSNNIDLDRKLPPRSPSPEAQSHDTASKKSATKNKDNRFICSICLETVSNEPVVTRCGHLYCWRCLYQWLEPGMILSEYRAAFGAASVMETTPRRAGGGGSLNFFNEMTYNHSNFNANHRPYNPRGSRYMEQRRCCPVCKADCTVDSVIPIYIHVHSPLMGSGTASSLSLNDDASLELESSRDGEGGAVSSSQASVGEAETPQGSPGRAPSSSFDTDPTSNVGLRLRRCASLRNEQPSRDEPTFDSPVNETAFVNVNSSRHTTNSLALVDTPVHRNRSFIDERDERTENIPISTSSQVPSRPVPTSPWVTNRTIHTTTPTRSQSAHGHRGQHDHLPQPIDTDANESSIGTSSPFRLGLRPRRQPFLSSSPPDARRGPFHPGGVHAHRGGLTSVLMGLVDTIDSLAASHHAASQSATYGQSTQEETMAVPPLHRSDGGMGGIGRASEQSDSAFRPAQPVLTEEESSLEMAKEFLSRLLLMLACFVILCLLLF